MYKFTTDNAIRGCFDYKFGKKTTGFGSSNFFSAMNTIYNTTGLNHCIKH